MRNIAFKSSPEQDVDRVFAAVADRTRLRILHLLGNGELCVCDLVDVLDVPQPKVSRHLATLKSAGLVAVRVDQNWRHYRLAEPASELHRKVLECVRCCGGLVPELRRDAQRMIDKGPCCATADAAPVRLTVHRTKGSR